MFKDIITQAYDVHATDSRRQNRELEDKGAIPLLRGLVLLETLEPEERTIGDKMIEELDRVGYLAQDWGELFAKLVYLTGLERAIWEFKYIMKKELKPRGRGRSSVGALLEEGSDVYNVFVRRNYGAPVITLEICGVPYLSPTHAVRAIASSLIAGIREGYRIQTGR
jgi:hypothetical protein